MRGGGGDESGPRPHAKQCSRCDSPMLPPRQAEEPDAPCSPVLISGRRYSFQKQCVCVGGDTQKGLASCSSSPIGGGKAQGGVSYAQGTRLESSCSRG